MKIVQKPNFFSLKSVPEFIRFQNANPQHKIDEKQVAIMYGKAIHWISFLDIIWPDFQNENYFYMELIYIVANDPEMSKLPKTFYLQIGETLKILWEIELIHMFPNGKWKINFYPDNPELPIDVEILSRE
jgi:hypothetical protein